MSKKVQNAVTLASQQALGADFNSEGINVKSLDNVGLIIETQDVTVGSGTFIVQTRALTPKGESSQWVDLTITPPMILSDADNSFAISLRSLPFSEVRVRFVAGDPGDDGSCNIWVEGKGGGQ